MCLLRQCNNNYVMITYESLRNRLNSNYAFYTSKCSFLKCFKSAKIAASQKTLGSPSSFPILPPFSLCEPVCTSLRTGLYQSLDRGQPVSSTWLVGTRHVISISHWLNDRRPRYLIIWRHHGWSRGWSFYCWFVPFYFVNFWIREPNPFEQNRTATKAP